MKNIYVNNLAQIVQAVTPLDTLGAAPVQGSKGSEGTCMHTKQ